MKKEANLRCGSEWVDHEDCIIGDEKGLKKLIKACEVALSKGEYFGDDLDDYVGIKKMESNWFDDPKDSTLTSVSNKYILPIFLIMILALIILGFIKAIDLLF